MFWIVTIISILTDQITKGIASKFLIEKSIPIISDIFELTFIENTGIAFGMFENRNLIFLIILPILLGLIYYWYDKNNFEEKSLVSIAVALVIGGGIGNYIDRVRLGYIVDFLHIKGFWIFNIADMAIVIGAILLIIYFVFYDKNRGKVDGRN